MKDFKTFACITLLLLCLSSCLSFDDGCGPELRIVNETEYALAIGIPYISSYDSTKSVACLVPVHPYGNVCIYAIGTWGKDKYSIADMISSYTNDKLGTIELYKVACDTCKNMYNLNITHLEDTCYAKWSGPIVTLPDSIHSFYNISSWKAEKGGVRCKYTIATFTITEDDLKQ